MAGKEQTLFELANDKWIGAFAFIWTEQLNTNKLNIKSQSKGTVLCDVFCNTEEGL